MDLRRRARQVQDAHEAVDDAAGELAEIHDRRELLQRQQRLPPHLSTANCVDGLLVVFEAILEPLGQLHGFVHSRSRCLSNPAQLTQPSSPPEMACFNGLLPPLGGW